MKKIVFLGDTIFNDEPLGIQRFAFEMIKQLDTMDLGYSCEILIPEYCVCNIDFQHIKVVKFGKIRNAFLWRQMCFLHYIKQDNIVGVDLTLGLCVAGCEVVGLYDCIHENYSEDFITFKEKLKALSYNLRARIAVKKAKYVITISEYSKNELKKCYRISEEKIKVIYCAWQHYNKIDNDESVIKRLELTNKQFFFSLGSQLPHKNIKWLINAAIQNPQYIFVITGKNNISSYNIKNEADNVLFTGYLSDEEIKTLMTRCTAFIHPSVYEGFGIPPIEALSCNTKILISDKTCLKEIYGESAMYFNPLKYDGIDIDMLLEQRTSGVQDILLKYSWEKSALILSEILGKLI